ncbi:hypothetical protein PHMEG_00014114, partial [Phytophthora megakarya]
KPIAELLELGQNYKSKKSRENQKRYRQKQNDLIVSLDKDIQYLQVEINTLEIQRRRMSAAIHGVWDVAVGYFRLNRNRRHRSGQLDNTKSSDVVYNSGYGLKVMMQSRRFLHWFDDVEEVLESLTKSPKYSMVATTRTSVTITQQTLTNVFPHLLRDDELHLRNKLLGQRMIMCGSTRFVWGGASDREVGVVTQSDQLTPMLRLLGSLESVLRVFEKALISPNFLLRSI